jgi:hypothetical protein
MEKEETRSLVVDVRENEISFFSFSKQLRTGKHSFRV